MKKGIILVVVLLTATLFVTAGEFWLEPRKFVCAVGEEVKVDFMEGDAFTGASWDMKQHAAEQVQWHWATGVKNITSTVTPTRGSNLVLKFPAEGTQVLVMRSRSEMRTWGAESFNSYVDEQEFGDGFRTSAADSIHENYTRFAKVCLQVGEKRDDTFKRKTGLRLEIIPLKNPCSLVTGDYLGCLILFDGKPLPNTLVKVWSRLNRTTFLQNIYSEKDGTVVFPISTRGAWMVSTARMVPADKPPATRQSLWSSLVFGI